MIVIKYGGAAMQDDSLRLGVIRDISQLAASGGGVVLVHGGGPELTALQERLGLKTKFSGGLRYTDEGTMNAALMALCGKVNKGIVRLLQNEGQKAAGLCGIDGGILRCERQKDPDLGFVGTVTDVDTGLLHVLLESGYIPVISTVGLGTDGLAYNINADTAAGRIAAALCADLYITMSDVPGVLREVDDHSTLIRQIRTNEVGQLIGAGYISGGMIPKVQGVADALLRGAKAASIIDGRVPHALMACLRDRESIGTMIVKPDVSEWRGFVPDEQ